MLNLTRSNTVHNYKPSVALLVFLYILLGSKLAMGQEITARASLDTNRILIGDQAKIILRVDANPGYVITWPTVDSLVKGIEILKRSGFDTLESSTSKLSLQQEYLITSFDSGFYTIPAFNLQFHKGNSIDTLRTLPLELQVLTLPVDTAKGIFDVKKPYGAPITLKEALPYIGFGALAFAVLVLGIYLTRKIRRHQPLIPVKTVSEPAHVIALRELDRLKEDKLWQQGLVKEYYTRLTDIIRSYIEARYKVPALEQTSDEIMESVKFIGFEEENTLHALRELLTLADLVKFAKALPLPGENENNILHAYLFINNTKQEILNIKDTAPQPASNYTENLEER